MCGPSGGRPSVSSLRRNSALAAWAATLTIRGRCRNRRRRDRGGFPRASRESCSPAPTPSRPGRTFNRTVRPGVDVEQHQPPSRLQHAEGLAVHRRLVGDVHHHVVRIGAVVARVGQRQGGGAALQDTHAIRQPARGVEFARRVAVFLGQVHAGDRTAEPGRDPACRAAQARSRCRGSPRRACGSSIATRSAVASGPAAVQMIDRRQGLRRDGRLGAGVHAHRGHDAGGDGTARAGTA